MECSGIIPTDEAVVLIAFVAWKPGLDSFCLLRTADWRKPVAIRELSLWEYFMGFSALFRLISI
jgi:hypothetical protein